MIIFHSEGHRESDQDVLNRVAEGLEICERSYTSNASLLAWRRYEVVGGPTSFDRLSER